MSKIIKVWTLLLCLAVAIGMCAACGGNNEKPRETDAPTAPTEPADQETILTPEESDTSTEGVDPETI